VRFIICIKDFGLFKKDVQYATPYNNLGPGVKQVWYKIYTKVTYSLVCNLSYKEFDSHFIYVGDFNIELAWCDELFNILMDGKGYMYNIV
jgi:hypothetical protein